MSLEKNCEDNNGNCNTGSYNKIESFCQNFHLVIGHGQVPVISKEIIIPPGYNIITLNQVGESFDWNDEILLYEMFSNIKENTIIDEKKGEGDEGGGEEKEMVAPSVTEKDNIDGSELSHFTHHQFIKYLTSPAFGNKKYCGLDISIHPPGCKINDTLIVLKAFNKVDDGKHLVQKTGIYNIPNSETPDVINSEIIWSKKYLSNPESWDEIDKYFKEIGRGDGLNNDLIRKIGETFGLAMEKPDIINMLNGKIAFSIENIFSGIFGGPGTYILPVCRNCNSPPDIIKLKRQTSDETSEIFNDRYFNDIDDSSKDDINRSLMQIILLHYCRMIKQMHSKIDDTIIYTFDEISHKNTILFKSLLKLLKDFLNIIKDLKERGISTTILIGDNPICTKAKYDKYLELLNLEDDKSYTMVFILNQIHLNSLILFIISLEGAIKVKGNFTITRE